MTLWKQGAEARLYISDFYGKATIVKERFSKKYRHPELDKTLTSQRTRSEVRTMMKCRACGIHTPAVYFVDMEEHKIYMEYLQDTVTVRDYIHGIQKASGDSGDLKETLGTLANLIGSTLASMHRNGIIHGDLTTSNMLLRNATADDVTLVLIDFGLGYIENVAEDKGVDLYVLERAFLSTHPNTESVFEVVLQRYEKDYGKGAADILDKLEEIRQRGRKRTMVG